MKNENNITYEIFINNIQFTCVLLEKTKMENNIPNIIGLSDLEFIEKKTSDDITTIKMYYRLKNITKIKIYLNEKIVIEDNYPLSMTLKRLRQLLINKICDNFNFTYNGSIIQRQEENLFSLKYVIKKDSLYLLSNLTHNYFIEDKLKNDKDNDLKNDKELKNNLNDSEYHEIISSNEENKNTNTNKNELINNEINDKNKTKNGNDNNINNECEYKIINNNEEKCKINISPEMTLTYLREKIYKLIPRRQYF